MKEIVKIANVAIPTNIPDGKYVLVKEEFKAYRYHIVRLDENEPEEKAIKKVPYDRDCGNVDQMFDEGDTIKMEVLPIEKADRLCTFNGAMGALHWISANYDEQKKPLQGPKKRMEEVVKETVEAKEEGKPAPKKRGRPKKEESTKENLDSLLEDEEFLASLT